LAEVPKELSTLLDSLLAKSPAGRPRDATTVAVELERLRRQLESGQAPTSASARERTRLRAVLPTALAVAALGAGAVFAGRRTTRASSAVALPAATGMLAIASDPKGARVELDGQLLDEATPTAIRGLSAGKHHLRISADKRTPVDEVIVLSEHGREVV